MDTTNLTHMIKLVGLTKSKKKLTKKKCLP